MCSDAAVFYGFYSVVIFRDCNAGFLSCLLFIAKFCRDLGVAAHVEFGALTDTHGVGTPYIVNRAADSSFFYGVLSIIDIGRICNDLTAGHIELGIFAHEDTITAAFAGYRRGIAAHGKFIVAAGSAIVYYSTVSTCYRAACNFGIAIRTGKIRHRESNAVSCGDGAAAHVKSTGGRNNTL